MEPIRNHTLTEYMQALLAGSDKSAAKSEETKQADTPVWPGAAPDRQKFTAVHDIIRFMDKMPGGFLIYHADGDEEIIYANKALLRIFRCDTLEDFRELTGNSFRGIVHPEDLDFVEQSIREQVAHSQYDLDYVEYRIIRKDGAIRWIEDYGHFTHNETVGDIFYVFLGDATEKKNRQMMEKVAILREKTEKERKLQYLIEEYDKERKLINQEHLRRLEVIEGLSVNYESILYVDLDANKILPYRLSNRTEHQFANDQRTRDFLWYTSDYINTWVHPEDRETFSRATRPDYIREKLSNVKTYYLNYRILKGIETQYLQLRVVNVGNGDHISQIVMGYRRVDEEILREMEQKQMLEEALNNARLANMAKNTFLSNMSHDMRTPLNAIFGYTALAKKHPNDNDRIRNYLDKIDASGRQLLDLIEKVLEISWMESHDIHITETECNLRDLLQDVHRLLLPQASDKNILFSVQSADIRHCDVACDQDKVRQLLLYLINNAIKYTKAGGRIDIIARETEKPSGDYAVYQFQVADSGIGIGQDFLAHVFEPFEREKNTTASGIYGTGLGLTIAKNIAEMMGGDITVNSTVGKGSTFTATLRLRVRKHPSSVSINGEQALNGLTSKKILLVEDNEINLEIETAILEGLGFLIEPAIDGSIAVEKIKNSAPGEYALILMDIQMPVMDGRQATRLIRRLKDPALARIPIIALSANAFESDKRLSIESGMNAHLTKPIDVPLLLETIAKTIRTPDPVNQTT
ncbi:MAG: response regulator [Lachnospiraceae bacterium]|nr:response regulator [Lachnospiraceae bacterium]